MYGWHGECDDDYKDCSTSTAVQQTHVEVSYAASSFAAKKKRRRHRKRESKLSMYNVISKFDENKSCSKCSDDNDSTVSQENQAESAQFSSDSVRTVSQENEVDIPQRRSDNARTVSQENAYSSQRSSDKVKTISQENQADSPHWKSNNVSRAVGQKNADNFQWNSDNVKTFNQEIQVDSPQWRSDNVSTTVCPKNAVCLQHSSDRVSNIVCQQNQAQCQTIITGDVFALNFHQEDDSVCTMPVEGVDSLVTLEDIEAFLPAIQSSFSIPAQFVETVSSDIQTKGSLQEDVLSALPTICSNCCESKLGQGGVQSVDQIVQTDCLEVKTHSDQTVQTQSTDVETVDKGTQTEHFQPESYSSGEAKLLENIDQNVQRDFLELEACICQGEETEKNIVNRTECFELETQYSKEDSLGVGIEGLKYVDHRQANHSVHLCAKPQYKSCAVGLASSHAVEYASNTVGVSDSHTIHGQTSAAEDRRGDIASNFQSDGKSYSSQNYLDTQHPEITAKMQSSWLDRLLMYMAVFLVIRLIFVGMCGILNFISHII